MSAATTRSTLARRGTLLAAGLAAFGAVGAGPLPTTEGPEPIGACVDQTFVEPDELCVFVDPWSVDDVIWSVVERLPG